MKSKSSTRKQRIIIECDDDMPKRFKESCRQEGRTVEYVGRALVRYWFQLSDAERSGLALFYGKDFKDKAEGAALPLQSTEGQTPDLPELIQRLGRQGLALKSDTATPSKKKRAGHKPDETDPQNKDR